MRLRRAVMATAQSLRVEASNQGQLSQEYRKRSRSATNAAAEFINDAAAARCAGRAEAYREAADLVELSL